MMVGYMDEDEDDPGRRLRLIDRIKGQCVDVPVPSDPAVLPGMGVWCTERFGPRRPYHPLLEAEEGRMDYFDGSWAVTSWMDSQGSHVISFWFACRDDRTLFTLTWLGSDP